MDRPRVVLGVDVGGTKVRFGLVREDGVILSHTQYPSRSQPARDWTDKLIRELDVFLHELPRDNRPAAIGIGMKGSVDHERQLLRYSSIVRNEQGYDIRAALRAHYGIPAFLENDVKAATIGELLFGLGRTQRTFACVNVGTGLSMGIVYEHTLLHGVRNDAGEIGNLLRERAEADGELVCLETVSSGQGLELEAMRLRESDPDNSLFANGQAPTSRQVLAACREGDALAQKAVGNCLHHLALTMINLEILLDLGRYVLVGGVMDDPWMADSLQKEIQRIVSGVRYRNFDWKAKVSGSELGAALSGLCGAGGVAFHALDGGS